MRGNLDFRILDFELSSPGIRLVPQLRILDSVSGFWTLDLAWPSWNSDLGFWILRLHWTRASPPLDFQERPSAMLFEGMRSKLPKASQQLGVSQVSQKIFVVGFWILDVLAFLVVERRNVKGQPRGCIHISKSVVLAGLAVPIVSVCSI